MPGAAGCREGDRRLETCGDCVAADVLIMIWKPLPWKKAPARVLALMLLNSDPGHHGTNTKGHNTAETTKKSSKEVMPLPCTVLGTR